LAGVSQVLLGVQARFKTRFKARFKTKGKTKEKENGKGKTEDPSR
jgi:hypothetical protein